MDELTRLYHTREEMIVLRDLVQGAIDAGHPDFTMLNSLRTMFAEAINGTSWRTPPATLVKLTLTDLDQLVAVMTGAVDRVENAGSVVVTQQLRDLRGRLIDADLQLRHQAGISTT